MKNERGITLIALVITVILMLILAGVAISALTGDGGLFDKSLKSAEAYEDASQKEKKQIDDLMNEIDGYIGDLTADKKAPSVAKLEVSNITDTGFTLTATGKDNVAVAKYEFYIKNGDGSFALEKTIETEDTTVTYDVTGKNAQENSYVYKLKVYDKVGNSKESEELLVQAADTTAPTVATLTASNITDTGFTLTANGEDDRGIVKYEFYIKNSNGTFNLEKTIEEQANTVTYTVTGKTPKQNSYTYKLKVYDKAGNSKESEEIVVGGVKASDVVKIGDYINYDAGVWTSTDIQKIRSSSGDPTTNNMATLPGVQGQFGGFVLGQSRNTNSTGYTTNGHTYTPRTSGWRVWDVDKNTGIVTLVSAGHPETYSHKDSATQTYGILEKRNYSMYVNKYATSAKMLTYKEVIEWYNARFGTNYTLIDQSSSTSSFFNKVFTTEEPISVLYNGGVYWISGRTDTVDRYMYYISNQVAAGNNNAMGIRILITLKSDVLLQPDAGDGSVDNPWKLSQM